MVVSSSYPSAQQGRINFVFGGNNVDDGLQSLSFCPKVHHLMERFKSQFRVVGDVRAICVVPGLDW